MSETNYFRHYANLGYDVIPIIPPDAKLAASTKVRDLDKGKVPGKRLPDGTWVGFVGWPQYQSTESDYDLWHSWEAGVGFCCGNLVAIDIDITEEMLADTVQRYFLTALGASPIRIGRAPKSLLIYRCDGEVRKQRIDFKDPDGESHAIEILGKGQQFVAHGIHPSGKPYEWQNIEKTLPNINQLQTLDLSKVGSLCQE